MARVEVVGRGEQSSGMISVHSPRRVERRRGWYGRGGEVGGRRSSRLNGKVRAVSDCEGGVSLLSDVHLAAQHSYCRLTSHVVMFTLVTQVVVRDDFKGSTARCDCD